MTTTINEYLDRIERMSSIHPVTLNDYPSSNRMAQTIAERVDTIIHSLTAFRGNVKEEQVNVIIENIWTMDATDSSPLMERIWGMVLETPIKIKEDNQIKNIKELADANEEPKDDATKKVFRNLKEKYEDCSNNVEQSFQFFNNVWALINADDGLIFKSDKPTIKQIYHWSNLIPPTKSINEQVDIPKWDSLCEKLKNCFCIEKGKCNCWNILIPVLSIILLGVVAWSTLSNLKNILVIDLIAKSNWLHYIFVFIVIAAILVSMFLLLDRIIFSQSKKQDVDIKLKEKMIDAVINAFNEDREYGMLCRKSEIALNEKLEKARIDEWCRNKEHLRRINIMEQERRNEYADTLKELANTKEKAVSQPDDCCEIMKKIARCILGDSDPCEKVHELLKKLLCDSDCQKKYEELQKAIEELKSAQPASGSSGIQQVVNINGSEDTKK